METKFIIKDKELDSRHLFIHSADGIADFLQRHLDEWHDKNSYPRGENEENGEIVDEGIKNNDKNRTDEKTENAGQKKGKSKSKRSKQE
jgi:hypothetical protein